MEYSGTDNLEIMACALNYNKFLVDTVVGRARPDQRVLDFGAGIGLFAKKVAAEGLDVSCLEPDKNQAMIIESQGLKVVRNIDALSDGSIDYIYTLNVLEHIDNDAQAIHDMRRILAPEGILFVYVPAFQILFSSMDKKVGHFRRYRKSHLVCLLEDAGFTVVRAEYVDSLGFFASLLYRIIGNKSGSVNEKALVLYDRFIFPVSRLLDFVFKRFLGKNVLVICRK
jgi:SAM-dependent methyltransferase